MVNRKKQENNDRHGRRFNSWRVRKNQYVEFRHKNIKINHLALLIYETSFLSTLTQLSFVHDHVVFTFDEHALECLTTYR